MLYNLQLGDHYVNMTALLWYVGAWQVGARASGSPDACLRPG